MRARGGPGGLPAGRQHRPRDGRHVIPSSQAVFDAVVYGNGELAQAPKTGDDWFRLQMHALAVAEAGNLLLIPGRAKDAGDWRTFAQAMTPAAAGGASAAESQDVEAVLQAGSDM